MKFKSLKTNLSSKARVENSGGVRYIVSPCVLLVEGVHNNVFYPASELAKFPEAWNNRPLPLSHPEIDGRPISANSREVMDTWSVGAVYNVKFEPATNDKLARLTGETWVNTEKLQGLADGGNKKALKLLEKLDRDDPIEVSTGLFTEDDGTPGTFNGEQYESTCYNYRPDHLAILVNETGACSVSDGCGMMVNKESRSTIKRLLEKFKKLTSIPVEMAWKGEADLETALDYALKEKLQPQPEEWIRINEHGKDDAGHFVVYELECRTDEGESISGIFRRNFSINEDNTPALADGHEVVAQGAKEESPRTNAETPTQGEPDQMKIAELVAAVIENDGNPFGADHESLLMKMNESQLSGLMGKEEYKTNASDCGCGGKGGEPAQGAVKAPAGGKIEQPEPAAPKVNAVLADDEPVTMSQLKGLLVNTLPDMIKEAVAAESEAGRKAKILAELKANAAVRIDDDILDDMSLPALNGIARSCGVTVDYSGNGGAPNDLNVNADADTDIPDMPAIDWSK